MQITKIYVVVLLLTIWGCGQGFTAEEMRRFIPGTYIRSSTHEFGKEWDTIRITPLGVGKDAYRLSRRWAYERTLDGVRLDPEYKVSESVAAYDEKKQLLWDEQEGLTYRLDPRGKQIFSGKTVYQKL